MTTQELLNYIKEQLRRGASKEDIKKNLLSSGWEEKDINEGLSVTSGTLKTDIPVQQTGSSNTSAFLGAISLLAETWVLYRQRFLVFFGIILIPSLMIAVPAGAFFKGGPLFIFIEALVSATPFLILAVLALLLFILSTVIQLWGRVALLYAIKDSDEKIGVIQAYRRGWHKILSYWWVSFLAGLLTAGGFLLFLVPGILFAVWFSLAFFILIAEDTGGMSALLKSREYIRGRWWSVLGRLVVIGLFSFFVSLLQ